MNAKARGKCFFISPIGEEDSITRKRSDVVKRLILESALVPEIVGSVERADEDANPGEITPAIIAAILGAELVVVDLTEANPNVFYEMAVAHAYGKPSVHIQLEGEALPFDIKDVRVFPYGLGLEAGDRAREAIRKAARFVLDTPSKARTPISGAAALLSADRSGDPSQELNATVLRRMDEIEALLRRAVSSQLSGSRDADSRHFHEMREREGFLEVELAAGRREEAALRDRRPSAVGKDREHVARELAHVRRRNDALAEELARHHLDRARQATRAEEIRYLMPEELADRQWIRAQKAVQQIGLLPFVDVATAHPDGTLTVSLADNSPENREAVVRAADHFLVDDVTFAASPDAGATPDFLDDHASGPADTDGSVG